MSPQQRRSNNPGGSGSGRGGSGRGGSDRGGSPRSGSNRGGSGRAGSGGGGQRNRSPQQSRSDRGGRGGPGQRRQGGQRDGRNAPHSQARQQAPRGNRRPRGLGGDHVEGRQAVRELLRAGKRKVREVLIAEDARESATLAEIVDLAGERRVPLRKVNRRRLDEAALTSSPQGVIAKAVPVQPADLSDLLAPKGGTPPLLVAPDGVTDPGNLGAILRTAEVAGATGVVLASHRSAGFTPAAVKAAAGAIEYLPIALVGGLPSAIATLRSSGVWVIGLDGHAPAGLGDIRVADEPVVLVVGAEGRGLSSLVEQRCDQVVSIPVRGKIESLNVAAAAAVALFDLTGRRQTSQPASQPATSTPAVP